MFEKLPKGKYDVIESRKNSHGDIEIRLMDYERKPMLNRAVVWLLAIAYCILVWSFCYWLFNR